MSTETLAALALPILRSTLCAARVLAVFIIWVLGVWLGVSTFVLVANLTQVWPVSKIGAPLYWVHDFVGDFDDGLVVYESVSGSALQYDMHGRFVGALFAHGGGGGLHCLAIGEGNRLFVSSFSSVCEYDVQGRRIACWEGEASSSGRWRLAKEGAKPGNPTEISASVRRRTHVGEVLFREWCADAKKPFHLADGMMFVEADSGTLRVLNSAGATAAELHSPWYYRLCLRPWACFVVVLALGSLGAFVRAVRYGGGRAVRLPGRTVCE